MGRLDGKIALITGGARGIGAETARLFANEGAKVIIADESVDEGLMLAKSINGKFYKLDASNDLEWQKVTYYIKDKYGRINILFNNAGITEFGGDFGPQDPENASLKDWQLIHQVNLVSVFLGCKYGIILMKNHGGSIINMSLKLGIMDASRAAAYASNKAAIHNHTKMVALYAAEKKYGIRCNSIHPGAILSPMWGAHINEIKHQQFIKTIANTAPFRRMVEPSDVANAVLFLASDESRYITGAELNIDRGISADTNYEGKNLRK